jgi:hypothetical protein
MKTWPIQTTRIFDDWFARQDEEVQVEVLATVQVLERMGPFLGRPWVDTLNGSKPT